MTNETANVKLPVRLSPRGGEIVDADGRTIAIGAGFNESIISILNSHTALIEAARAGNDILAWYAIWQRDPDKSPATASVFFEALRTALEKVKL